METGKAHAPSGAASAESQGKQGRSVQQTRSCDVRPGDACPVCSRGRMDYDGLLNLVCPNCGYTLGGSFT
jgi:uncharacterized protein (DUF983 family)